jgi:hypothetical protein
VQILLIVALSWLALAVSLAALLAGMWRHVVGPTADDVDGAWGSTVPAPRVSGDSAALPR